MSAVRVSALSAAMILKTLDSSIYTHKPLIGQAACNNKLDDGDDKLIHCGCVMCTKLEEAQKHCVDLRAKGYCRPGHFLPFSAEQSKSYIPKKSLS